MNSQIISYLIEKRIPFQLDTHQSDHPIPGNLPPHTHTDNRLYFWNSHHALSIPFSVRLELSPFEGVQAQGHTHLVTFNKPASLTEFLLEINEFASQHHYCRPSFIAYDPSAPHTPFRQMPEAICPPAPHPKRRATDGNIPSSGYHFGQGQTWAFEPGSPLLYPSRAVAQATAMLKGSLDACRRSPTSAHPASPATTEFSDLDLHLDFEPSTPASSVAMGPDMPDGLPSTPHSFLDECTGYTDATGCSDCSFHNN